MKRQMKLVMLSFLVGLLLVFASCSSSRTDSDMVPDTVGDDAVNNNVGAAGGDALPPPVGEGGALPPSNTEEIDAELDSIDQDLQDLDSVQEDLTFEEETDTTSLG